MGAIEQGLQLDLKAARAQPAPSQYSRAGAITLGALDVSMFLLATYIALGIVEHRWNARGFLTGFVGSSVYVCIIWLVIFERVGLYRRSFALSVKDEFYYTVTALICGILPQLVLFTLVPVINESRLVLLLSAAFAIALVGGTRAVAHAVNATIAHRRPRRIAIVGSSDRIATVAQSLNIVEGTVVLRLDVPDMDETLKSVNPSEDTALDEIPWLRMAKRWGCDTLLLTEVLPPHIMPHLLEIAAQRHIKVAFAPPRVQCHAYSLSLTTDGQQALIVPSRLRACTPPARLLKRLMDLAIAIPATLLLLPIMGIVALAIYLESGSPVLFRQERVGRGGKTFDVLKFRTMKLNAEAETGPVWARPGDSRTTKVGAFLRKTSLDELPQFFNVLRGEMSVVGPRPERPVFVNEFQRLLPRYAERHLVRPGITGWSQVNLRRVLQPTDAAEKLSYDLFYIEHWALFMDLSVIFKTGFEFLFHRAA